MKNRRLYALFFMRSFYALLLQTYLSLKADGTGIWIDDGKKKTVNWARNGSTVYVQPAGEKKVYGSVSDGILEIEAYTGAASDIFVRSGKEPKGLSVVSAEQFTAGWKR